MFKKFLFCLLSGLLLLTACTLVRVGGIVQGVVYGDLNSDGMIDASEELSRVPGAEVLLTGCGPDQTQLTDLDGNFHFGDLPEGSCSVSVSKAGWIYDGSYPDLGTYPIPVASNPDLATSFSIYMAPVMDFIPTETPVGSPTVTPEITLTVVSTEPRVTPGGEDVNCRFGPATTFLTTGALRGGESALILGTTADRGWWKIEDPRYPGTFCWVSAVVTITSGDLSGVPVLPFPTGLVTSVTVAVNSGAVLHGSCGFPNNTSFTVSITTNGPAAVVYRVDIYNADGSFKNSPGDASLTFLNASTQTIDPGGVYHTDCGSFYIVASTSSPNGKSARADWSVVEP